jgi:hypothetical protein
MATIYRCDKCHREGSEPSFLGTTSVAEVMTPTMAAHICRQYELCSRCRQRLNDWLMVPDPVETTEERE